MNNRLLACLTGSALVFGFAGSAAAAESVADFYKGNDITIICAFGAGGGYGLYAQELGHYMGDYVPGKPNIIVTYMPGAGGSKAAMYLYAVAPKNGSTMGLLSNATALAQILKPKQLHYDARKFQYIGSMMTMRSAIIVWHTAPVKKLSDARTHTIVFGATGTSSQDYMNPMLMKNILGYKVKVVKGYKGSRTVNNAMEKGEVQAMSNSWTSVKSRLGDWLHSGKINVIAMVGLTPAPDLPNVPLLIDQAKNKEDRAVMELMASTTEIGRAFALPPGAPMARVKALRKALKATMKDPKLKADAKKRDMGLAYTSPEKIEQLTKKTINAPKKVVQHFIDALELGGHS